MTPIEAFRDLFLLNPEIQNRLKSVSADNFLSEARAIGEEFNLIFTEDELKDFIDNFGRNREGDSPICIAMGKPADDIPLTDADGVINFVLDKLNDSTVGTGVCARVW
jgi:hypothetical protein